MKAYKGFNEDMQSSYNKFQYEEGKEYTTDSAKLCESGFHACGHPLDCFKYYNPADSEFHEVELNGDIDGDIDDFYLNGTKILEGTKICATKIKVGLKLDIVDMIKAAINFTMSRAKYKAKSNEEYCASFTEGPYSTAYTTGAHSASSARGTYCASSATGIYSTSHASGFNSASSATGDCSASFSTGYHSTSSAAGDCNASAAIGNNSASATTGDRSASSAIGNRSVSAATGDCSFSSVEGNCSVSSATGYKCSVIANNPTAIAVAWGYKGKAKGVKGSRIVLTDWEGNDKCYHKKSEWNFKGAKMVKIDGRKYKADTWYTMKEGKIIEWKDGDE